MNYPKLTHSDVHEFIDTVVRLGASDSAVKRFLEGKQIDESKHRNTALTAAVKHLIEDCGSLRNSDLEPIEARHCGPVFRAIDGRFGDEEIGDVQFWSFLAVRYFWQFISYRQEAAWLRTRGEAVDDPTDEADRAKLERYLLGKDHYQIPLRMYLRAQAVREADDFTLAEIGGGSTDFWRSQVLGVRTAMFPPVARTVARLQNESELNIEQQRPAGRRVNRLRVNVDFVLHDDDDANAAIRKLWVVTETDVQEAVQKKAAKKASTPDAPTRRSPAKKATPSKKSLDGGEA